MHSWYEVDTKFNFVSTLYQIVIKVDAKLIHTQQCWIKVDAKLILSCVSTSYQFRINSSWKFIQSWYTSEFVLSCCNVDTRLNFVSALHQICINFGEKLLQRWYIVDTKLYINHFASFLHQLCINCVAISHKIDTKLIHKWVGTKLLQSCYKVVYQLCINFASFSHQLYINSVYIFMKVDTKLIHNRVETKLKQSWYKVVHQLCVGLTLRYVA